MVQQQEQQQMAKLTSQHHNPVPAYKRILDKVFVGHIASRPVSRPAYGSLMK